jgi:hypothetical protein|tara:strand:+ start:37 stop:522 length:486 start_codon:yes stop_codon:yes gene_type:complete
MAKIVDNFLPTKNFNFLQKIIMEDQKIPYYYNDSVAIKNDKQGVYFSHMVFELTSRSELFQDIRENLIEKIPDLFALRRIKINLYPSTENLVVHNSHFDYKVSHKGLLLCLNTCDGYTMLEDGKKIDSIENRALFFDPSKLHSSTNCTNKKARFNININYT